MVAAEGRLFPPMLERGGAFTQNVKSHSFENPQGQNKAFVPGVSVPGVVLGRDPLSLGVFNTAQLRRQLLCL